MQYIRSFSNSVNTTWNSINPATLSGAIDVIVVEQEDGSLACSPFHIRFGKFRLLRPTEKKVEFAVNGRPQSYPMKLGEGGEAFFVFETRESVPEALQTSPLVSPETSPQLQPSVPHTPALQEPDPFDLEQARDGAQGAKRRQQSKSTSQVIPILQPSALSDVATHLSIPHSTRVANRRPASGDFSSFGTHLLPRLERNATDSELDPPREGMSASYHSAGPIMTAARTSNGSPLRARTDRSNTPPALDDEDAKTRAMNISKKLWTSNISNHVTESGDLMLDMTGYKSSDGEALQAEIVARQLLSEELDGPYDIGALISADEKGNLWIYRSEEAKDEANRKAARSLGSYNPAAYASTDAISDPGYHSDDAQSESAPDLAEANARLDSDSAVGMTSQPGSPGVPTASGDPNLNYAKTLRLTSEQLQAMDLRPGANPMSFTVNRATCAATLWYWQHDVPIVISDIDGTITKSDVLGHINTFIGRDWTHPNVAKLYTDIAANGYNFLYLTSRSVGQADMTRAYLDGILQDGMRLPKGPVILSPDRTMAALRREVYLRKPEVFKMSCLRDIMALFSADGGSAGLTESQAAGLHLTAPGAPGGALGSNRGRGGSPFYAGFGNRLTDALSYRSVNIPSTRIFTINSNGEVSLDLLSLNHYKTAYNDLREIVDHYFPAVGLLVRGGGEEFTDFNYWRAKPLDIVDFTDSDSDADDDLPIRQALQRLHTSQTRPESLLSEDEGEEDEDEEDEDASERMTGSYLSDPRHSLDESRLGLGDDELAGSILVEGDEEEDEDDEAAAGESELASPLASPPLTPKRATTLPAPSFMRTPTRAATVPLDVDEEAYVR